MPNHVINHISVIGDDKQHTMLRQIAEFLRPEGKSLGHVDFNNLIPMPVSLQIEAGSRGEWGLKLYRKYISAVEGINIRERTGRLTEQQKEIRLSKLQKHYMKLVKDDPEVFELGKQYYENIRQYGCTTWYDWCIKNWGTKWNAYECIPWDKSMDRLSFYTAWDGVPAILEALSKQFAGMEIEYRWADENIGNNVGWMVFRGGAITEDMSPYSGSKEAFEQAAEMWGFGLEDEGYRLSKDGSTYEDVYNAEPSPSMEPSFKKNNKDRGREC